MGVTSATNAQLGRIFRYLTMAPARLSGGVVIGDNVKIGSNCILGYHKGYPKIGDNVTIFPNSIIIGNITIGKNSIIGAGTYVDKDVPPNSVVYNKKELIIKLRSEQ